MFACISRPPSDLSSAPLSAIADQFSPRYEQHCADLVTLDLAGLERLFGDAQLIGEELRRTARAHQMQVQVAIAATRTAALILAQARPGLTVVAPGDERAALAPLPIRALEFASRAGPSGPAAGHDRTQSPQRKSDQKNFENSVSSGISVLNTWGIRTLGELAALPPADLSTRLGQAGVAWQAIARGEDARPLVPTMPDERFESSLELEWPIDGLEPLSFVLTRLLEPLVIRLERRDCGAAAVVTTLRLVTRETCTRRLELPTPLRDVRTLRTLVLLDLDSHPAGAAIDVVTIVIEPTPGRILQHTLFTRPTPTPEQISTLVARLHALMGQDRVGAPVAVDSYRPGAFGMKPFATDHDQHSHLRASGASASLADARNTRRRAEAENRGIRGTETANGSASSAGSALNVNDDQRRDRRDCREAVDRVQHRAHEDHGDQKTEERSASSVLIVSTPQALRRCRQPVPARVAVEAGRPVRVTTDRRGYTGGRIVRASGPWCVSGEWWEPTAYRRDEWDVELADGAVYRVFRDDFSDRWFIDAVFD